MPSKAKDQKIGDKISKALLNAFKELGLEIMESHVCLVEGEERTVFGIVPSNNGWQQGHNMVEIVRFTVMCKKLVCRTINIPEDSCALLTCDS